MGEKNNPKIAAPFSVSPEKYGDFLGTLFDLWREDLKNDRPTTSVRFFDPIFYTYVGLELPECTFLPECGSYVVEQNGDVYSCDFFVELQWKLGSVHEDEIIELMNCDNEQRSANANSSGKDRALDVNGWLAAGKAAARTVRMIGVTRISLISAGLQKIYKPCAWGIYEAR